MLLTPDSARDLQIISDQERALVFPTFSHSRAWQVGVHVRELAVARSLAVAIDVRVFGHQLFFCALDKTTPDNIEWIRRKVNVTARFYTSSYAIGLKMQQMATTLEREYGLSSANFIAHGGCFPITVGSSIAVGSVTVSGLTQREDHELVTEALCCELGHDYQRLALPLLPSPAPRNT